MRRSKGVGECRLPCDKLYERRRRTRKNGDRGQEKLLVRMSVMVICTTPKILVYARPSIP